jgi:hypothetical protein
MRPGQGALLRRMDAFRDFFFEAFSETGDATVATSPEPLG